MMLNDIYFNMSPELIASLKIVREDIDFTANNIQTKLHKILDRCKTMTTKINWENEQTPKTLYFEDVPVNAHFVIDTIGSYGAVYRKVESGFRHQTWGYAQLEEFTGKVFEATKSPIRIVEVDIKIKSIKPTIYS